MLHEHAHTHASQSVHARKLALCITMDPPKRAHGKCRGGAKASSGVNWRNLKTRSHSHVGKAKPCPGLLTSGEIHSTRFVPSLPLQASNEQANSREIKARCCIASGFNIKASIPHRLLALSNFPNMLVVDKTQGSPKPSNHNPGDPPNLLHCDSFRMPIVAKTLSLTF